MSAHYFKLSVDVQRKIKQPRPCSRRVAGGHGLQRIVDLLLVTSADGSVVHEARKSAT